MTFTGQLSDKLEGDKNHDEVAIEVEKEIKVEQMRKLRIYKAFLKA